MKILVIHEVSYLDKPVYEYQDFAERLAARGHQVTVIDFSEKTKDVMKTSRVSRTGLGEVKLISLENNGLPILRYLVAKLRFPGQLESLFNRERPDAVLLYSVFINGSGAVSVCRKFGVPIVFRVLDAYHRLRKNPFESWLLRQGERFIYSNVNALSVTNNQMAHYVKMIAGAGLCAPVHVIDHGVDTDHFQRVVKNEVLARQLGIEPTDFICVFLGTTYKFSRIDYLIKYIPLFRKAIPGFKLLIIGAGELDDEIRNLSLHNDVAEFVLQPGMISYSELPSYLSMANIAINSFEINDITRDIIPIKILQYLASQLPVVSTPLPDLVRKFPHEISGAFYSNTDDMNAFIHTLIHVATTCDFARVGQEARLYVKKCHSMNKVIAEFEGLLEARWNI